jgi:CDP-glucose 4,6-dehydratase
VEFGRRTLEGLAVTPAFWRDRRVLITGHTGFKGSWLTLWLDRLGAKVTGYALAPPTVPNLFELADVGSHARSISADVRDLGVFQHALGAAEAEIIFHLAAQSLVRESYRAPIDTFATNIMGTANLLEAVKASNSVRAVVVVTSDKCYENREQQAGYRETDPMGGHDPYSSSKGAAELVTSSYRRTFFYAPESPAIATARAGNVIGGGDFATDRLLPDCVRALERKESVAIRNPDSTRPWQFVLEPLAG